MLLKYCLDDANRILRERTQGYRDAAYEEQLSWLLAYKATAQVYGHVVNRLLDETVALTDQSWYWDGVLSSRFTIVYYGVQTLPLRAHDWLSTIWSGVKQKRRIGSIATSSRDAVTSTWHEFYELINQVVRERRIVNMRTSVLSPIAQLRSELRQKQDHLLEARTNGANILGMVVDQGLLNATSDLPSVAATRTSINDWKSDMLRSNHVLSCMLAQGATTINASLSQPPQQSVDQILGTLVTLLNTTIPAHSSRVSSSMRAHGRPSAVIRYWPAAAVAILSSSTVLRILLNRKAEVTAWIRDLGTTVLDFWRNWVIEPTRKVIATIRHDEGSEVSIMSKRSLQGDRDSLERMVVDFAIDNPANATDTGSPLTGDEIAAIRSKIREGDLTPVLKAYEKDLVKPFSGTIRGNLIRALLIQIQKTKVDVEVAMGGIDALLKSQELVFGFVGLTPGLLVMIALGRWLRQASAGRKALRRDRKQGVMIRQLRNIDRLLCGSTGHDRPGNGVNQLDHQSYGLLLCEVHVLSQQARRMMPDQTYREFAQDLEQLFNIKSGIEKQSRVVARIRWAYARWL